MHDSRAWRESGLADMFTGRLHRDGGPGGFADTAYAGTGLLIPQRRTNGQPLTTTAREFNRAIASRRASAHLKNSKILATGYRGLLPTFPGILEGDHQTRDLPEIDIHLMNNFLSTTSSEKGIQVYARHLPPGAQNIVKLTVKRNQIDTKPC